MPLTPDEVRDQKIAALEKSVRELRTGLAVTTYSLLAGVIVSLGLTVWVYSEVLAAR